MANPFSWSNATSSPSTGGVFNNLHLRSSDSDKVFEKLVPVAIQISTNEERKQMVKLSVEFTQGTIANSSYRKDLNVEITDEEDPYIYYTLRMTEEDFCLLKSQQGLLVDFTAFPSKFVQLVERCITEHQSDSPKFLILLRHQNEGAKTCILFEIVETNPFKHLCHLSLKLVEGSERQIKSHLSRKLQQFKDEKDHMMKMIRTLEQQLEAERKSYNSTSSELEHLKAQFQTKLHETEQTLRLEFQTEKHLVYQSKCDLEQQMKMQQLEFVKKETQWQAQVKELNERKYDLESDLKQLNTKLKKTEDECSHLQQELSSNRRRTASLDTEFHNKEKAINHLRTKLAVAEQELKDKDVLLAKQQDLLTASQEQKARLSDLVEEKETLLGRRESAVKAMTEELIKANDIIRKLQTEMRTLTAKLKTRTEVASEQEKILQQREAEIAQLREKTDKIGQLQDEVDRLRTRNDEKDRAIQSNEQIISYLNKQLNDVQINNNNRMTNSRKEPWFSTPHEGHQVASPNLAISAVKTSNPLTTPVTSAPLPPTIQVNSETCNDEPLDAKYFQPKVNYAGGIIRKDKSTDRAGPKPSAYFKK